MYTDLLTAIDATDPSGRAIPDPATGEVIGHAPEQGVDDLDRAVDAATTAQPGWEALGHEERSRLLRAAADAVDAHAEDLAQLLTRETGKPLNGPNARMEVAMCGDWLRATAGFETPGETLVSEPGNAGDGGDTGDTGAHATLAYEPIGVVGAIGPWNWPLMITVWQVAAALRMGNTAVVKPSEYTPLSVLSLVHVLNQALPDGVLHVVSGGRDVGARLSGHPGIGKIMFTGSIPTGRAIAAAGAGTLKRLTLELGGNDPAIILDDCDPAAIAEDLFWGAFINTGQTCAAVKRVYATDAVYDDLCAALAEIAAAVPMGPGTDEDNVLGPLQNPAQFRIVADLVDAARDAGARILTGGDPAGGPGNFYPATIVSDVASDNPLVVEEQFGPALPIVRVRDADEAVALANSLDVGLGASVWSADRDRALEVARRVRAGTVWINGHAKPDPRIPFGGIKQSGYGLEFGAEGLKAVAVPKVYNG
ncbi:aldehyde dehydrogenase family protein [Corynebacterium kalidii]|uniref:Aldehyde dehydrogenase family protein n=1 Tax=Corynebacterium kalidii TaxID=2931982 RepID=A0A9X1WNQ7_9CORY|nr:aldehyde dehydrogenase family protein [Corynebacterium kalidii]MCJ7858451.1 aldehyde dehydrogenase family protein [Corynebacterium kalidii]